MTKKRKYIEKHLPSISIVTVSFNPKIDLFRKFLDAIKIQDYPKSKIEHIVVDGGSKNKSIDIAKKEGCKVLVRKDLQQEAEERQYIGFKKATNDIILVLETDNILPNSRWLKQMVAPFMEDKDIFCTFSSYNCVNQANSLLSKYCALFGVSDPVLFYLGKSEKLTWQKQDKKYDKGKILSQNKNYSSVQFGKENLPVMGDNGSLFKREAFLNIKSKQKNFVHLDLFMDFLDKGYNKFGVVYNCIVHETGSNILQLIKRRLLYTRMYSKEIEVKRRYMVYDPSSLKDKWNILKFCIFTITLIEPIAQSLYGYYRKREIAWFLHPMMCWTFFLGYIIFETKQFIKNKKYEKTS